MTVRTSPTTALKKREIYLRAKMRSHKNSIRKSHRSLKRETLLKFAVASSGVTKLEPVKLSISFDSVLLCTVNDIISCDAQSCQVGIHEGCLNYEASLIRGGNDNMVTMDDNDEEQMRPNPNLWY